MPSERLPTDQPYAGWKIEKTVSDHHIEIRITPENGQNANEAEHVAQVRKLTLSVLAQLGITRRLDEIALIVDEFAANCVEHGDGIHEVDLDLQPDVLRVQTVNGIRRDDVRLVSEDQRGELISDLGNDEAEDGRGMLLTEALADAWEQTVRDDDTVVTYADFRQVGSDDNPFPPSKAA